MRWMHARAAPLLALLLAGVTTAVVIRQASYSACYSDAAGYLNQARGFPSGQHLRAIPVVQWASWRFRNESTVSLAARNDLLFGTEVGMTPLGNPVLIAAAQAVGGHLAGFLVAPVSLGILIGCAFAAAHTLAGARAGLIAALLIGTTPSLVLAALQPMSDVPAAAFWGIAFVMALRGSPASAAAAAAAVAMAFLIRPQLAVLGVVPAYFVLIPSSKDAWRRPKEWRWRHALAFGVTAASGPLILFWSQAVLYGSPTTPGYAGPWTNFGREHFTTNIRMYPRLIFVEHSPVLALGLFAAPWWRRLVGARPDDPRGRVVTGLAAWSPLNLATYLFYLPYDHWPFLRFLAPAIFAMTVLFAAFVVWLGDRLSEGNPRIVRHIVTLTLTAVPLVAVQAHTRHALRDSPHDRRQFTFGRYMDAALPPNAVIVTFLHSASTVYYTGRPIVRYDQLDPPEFDRVIASIKRHGSVPYLLLEERLDTASFRDRLRTSQFGALDWPPRAVSSGPGPIELRAFDDRARHINGERWPIDVVSYPR